MRTIVVGAGAAGCFAAIELKRLCPHMEVVLLEKSSKPLAKVAITGGGRCNLTNSFAQVKSLEQVYPRGHRLMKRHFHRFSHRDTYEWFEREGVSLITQEDQCVFPLSQDAMEIVGTLTRLIRQHGINLYTHSKVNSISHEGNGYRVETADRTFLADHVLISIGGQPSEAGFSLLKTIPLKMEPSRPSLFSFCIEDTQLRTLMGIVVTHAKVSLTGTKAKGEGPLLITHWGVSGPAVLRLSSVAAKEFAERDYQGDISIRWVQDEEEDLRNYLRDTCLRHAEKKLSTIHPEALHSRLWEHLIARASLQDDLRWKAMTDKDIHRLTNVLTNDVYRMTGKNRFKEEFVTCGGVALSNLHAETLEAKEHPGLFFAGEATDVDAVTGGFNLQAAWTMGYVAAHGIAARQGDIQ